MYARLYSTPWIVAVKPDGKSSFNHLFVAWASAMLLKSVEVSGKMVLSFIQFNNVVFVRVCKGFCIGPYMPSSDKLGAPVWYELVILYTSPSE